MFNLYRDEAHRLLSDTAFFNNNNNNLILNPEKCKAMVISNNTQIDDLLFTIDGIAIAKVDSLELLGTVVEKSLNFSNHISKIAKKVGKQLDILSRFRNILSCSTKMCLYKSFIIPHFMQLLFNYVKTTMYYGKGR